MEVLPDPVTASDAYLATGCDDGEPVIDRIFASGTLSALLDDCALDLEDAVSSRTAWHPIRSIAGHSIASVPEGLVVMSGAGTVSGVYLGAALAVAPEWQGRGLASEICLHAYCSGGAGVWSCDKPGFSPGGYRAHLAVRRLARDARMLADVLRYHMTDGDGIDAQTDRALTGLARATDHSDRLRAYECLRNLVPEPIPHRCGR